jgi:hypothetical protein
MDIETRSRRLFDESVERVDGATRSRLTQARHAALAELDRPRFRAADWLPAGAIAAAATVAVMVWMQPGPARVAAPAAAVTQAEDFELLTLGDDLDLLGEDVEFYAWAVAEDGSGIG